uniref:Uncharacterized protein n=1 Tax=Ditylenchus dipsaci TaxID=166011 RepID=A0A915D7Q4_9BILA
MLNPVNFIRDTGQLKILLGFLAIAFGFAQRIGSSKDADEIKQLPGLTFDYPANSMLAICNFHLKITCTTGY